MNDVDNAKKMLGDSKFFMGYSRYDEDKGGYETWEQSVKRVMDMHRHKYQDVMTDELAELIDFAEHEYMAGRAIGSQRNLQFGGEQILKKPARQYNCTYSHANRPDFFEGAMYLLLCGCGVGFSVQKHHIAQLPKVKRRFDKKSKVFTVPDNIEGWAQAFGVLLSSFFEDGGEHPEYRGCQVHFDFSQIRPKGSYISGGFKAPGPDGLRQSLQRCEELLVDAVAESKEPLQLRPIQVYDFVMHMADAVLSGGKQIVH